MSLLEHYAWPVSHFSAKTRPYLRFKGIPHREVRPTVHGLGVTVRRAVGRSVMPTVRLPDGRWLQDTSDIIDELERRFPEPSITPPGHAQRVASLLLELFGDEWLVIVAMHYRWNLAENRRFEHLLSRGAGGGGKDVAMIMRQLSGDDDSGSGSGARAVGSPVRRLDMDELAADADKPYSFMSDVERHYSRS